MTSPRALAFAATMSVLAGACAAHRPPSVIVPPFTSAAGKDPPTGPEAEPAPGKLAFRMPCADDDIEACAKGCAEQQTEDCVTLGSIYLGSAGAATDAGHAVALFRAACAGGSARGCIRMGDAYRDGVLKGNVEEAEYYSRACEAGANLGCVAAGKVYLSGHGIAPDPGLAASLFARVCEKGNADGCFELARMLRGGEGVKKDLVKAAELFDKACKLGMDQGCVWAGKGEKGAVVTPRE